MEKERFMRFVHLVDGVHKFIQKLRNDYAVPLGVKSVHIFWLLELSMHPEGMSAAELAACSHVDRSLISREITSLSKNGIVTTIKPESKRNYNSKLVLTEKGEEVAKKVKQLAMNFQAACGDNISDGELEVFYATFEKLYENFNKICNEEA